MEVAVVVPGIMGSRLRLPGEGGGPDEEVWPPEPLETQFGYKRREKLASPKVVIGPIIENVLCFDFYGPLFGLFRELGFTESSSDQRLIKFPYDWRLDLFTTADRLADVLDTAHRDGARAISLVGHSMGGLICRLVLESPVYRSRPWFGSLRQFVAVATPHAGAPLALARVLGADSALGISGKDFAWLSSLEAYPSAYQLLPGPGEDTCWDQASEDLEPLDIHRPEVAARLGLNHALLARNAAVHGVLGAGQRPAGVRYFYFAGAGHRTATRVNVFANGTGIERERTVVSRTEDAGDGTVPLFSALARAPQRHIATNEHATAFKGSAFRAVFLRLFGGDAGPALEALVGPRLALSLETPVAQAQQDIEVLLYADLPSDEATAPLDAVQGELVLRKIRDGDAPVSAEIRRVPVSYAGPRVNRLRFYLDPVDEPGHYELRFEGAPEPARVAFAVCSRQSEIE